MFLSSRTPAELAQGLGLNSKEVGGRWEEEKKQEKGERGGEEEEKGDSYSEESLRMGKNRHIQENIFCIISISDSDSDKRYIVRATTKKITIREKTRKKSKLY